MASYEGSFVRWQAITLAQLGFVANLILTLAVAALGFALGLVKDADVIESCWARCLLVFSIAGFLISLALGILCALTRLDDFRKTAQNARNREKLPTMTSAQDELGRKKTNSTRGARKSKN